MNEYPWYVIIILWYLVMLSLVDGLKCQIVSLTLFQFG